MANAPTTRDLAVLRDLWLYRYLTTSHIARLHFGHAKLAQRRLRILTARRLVDRFLPPAARQAGFGAWWYRLASKGAHHLAETQGLAPKDLLPPKRSPRTLRFLDHHALVTTIRIWLREGTAKRTDGFRYEFIPEYEEVRRKGKRHRRIALTVPGHRRTLIPDGAFTLQRGGTTALFFLEADRGTEPLTGKHPGAIERKLTLYRDAFDTNAEAHYGRLFGAELRGFRILCTVPDADRQAGFLILAAHLELAPLVWVTTNDTFNTNGDLARACWLTEPDGTPRAMTE